MSDHFEDELRATMRDHDHEAPTAAALPDFRADDGPRVPTGGRYTWLPIAAAAAAVLTLVGITFALGPGENRGAPKAGASSSTTTKTAASPLSCPAKYVESSRSQLWVPTKPQGVDATSRMAPAETPTHAVVCAYLKGQDLSGGRDLTGDLDAATQTLAYLPPDEPSARHACATYSSPSDGENYLIGLTYRDGTVWVSAPGQHCEGASNGVFTTNQNLRQPAAASYAAGRWTERENSSPKVGICGQTNEGRLGQSTSMVPGTPTSVTICVGGSADPPHRTTADVAELVRELNRLPTVSSMQSCAGGPSGTTYRLRFDYSDGPPVWVLVMPGCRPSIINGNLQANDPTAIVRTITALLR